MHKTQISATARRCSFETELSQAKFTLLVHKNKPSSDLMYYDYCFGNAFIGSAEKGIYITRKWQRSHMGN